MGVEFREKGLVTLIPRASFPQKKFGELSFEEIKALTPELTEEEKQSPFADLYEKGNILTERQEKAVEGPPIGVEEAFEPEDYAKNMNRQGYTAVENGYCVLESGAAYSAAILRQVGRTNENMDAYNKEFAPEGALAYKLWCPGYHYYHYSDGAIEDFGYGLLNMKAVVGEDHFANGMDIRLLGVDPDKVKENDPDCLWLGGNYWMNYPVLEDRISEKPIEMIIVNYLRKTDYGRELRIRLFGGVGIRDGKLVRTGFPEGLDPMECARMHMRHLMLEYGNEARWVNEYWNRKNQTNS